MSSMGNNNPMGGNPSGDNGQGNANFDMTTGPGSRDAWNNPVKQQRQQTQNTEDKSGGDPGDNGGIDDDLIANIWDKVENKDVTTQQTQQTQQTTQTQPVDENAKLQKYLTDNGLGGIQIGDAEKEAASNGDFGPLMNKVNQYVVNSHIKSLSGAQIMIQAAVKEAVAEVNTKATANYMGHKNLDAMHDKLPFTKLKHIAPVAASILQKSLDRGLDTEKAIEVVDLYFQDISSQVSGNKVNTNRNGNFNSNQKGDKKTNWLTMLSPGN